ncbi:MAG: hypothetical protein IJJ64_00525 [Butyrivibrio sp.]|nr:hypothetical protein [Butyrivibrio sp.]
MSIIINAIWLVGYGFGGISRRKAIKQKEREMGNWGDDQDYEAKLIKEHKGRFTMNFKKIFYDVDEISQKTLEVTDKHPKDSLLKLWAGTMLGIGIFFLCSYQFFALVMVPFIAFYLIALVRIYKCWKSFKYNSLQFWGMSIAAMIVLFAISRVLQHVIGILLS